MLRKRGNSYRVEVTIPADEDGMTGRECPVSACLGYFKVKGGTGLVGKDLPCHCPYCGHKAPMDQFWTKDQIEYAKSHALRKLTNRFVQDLKRRVEYNHRPRGPFGIGFKMTLEPGRPLPLYRYREKRLETQLTCSNCTLQYAIYGVFGYCPDCSMHNSLQILQKNLELAGKQLALSDQIEDAEFKRHMIEDALENAISAFDGYGRELCAVHKTKATQPAAAKSISFQNIEAADRKLNQLFSLSLSTGVQSNDWRHVLLCFQKRHLLAHTMGVIDEKYVNTGLDPSARVGRRVQVSPDDVRQLLTLVQQLGTHLTTTLT